MALSERIRRSVAKRLARALSAISTEIPETLRAQLADFASGKLRETAFFPEKLRADPPQRYTVNAKRYESSGGLINLRKDIGDFIKDSENNEGDLARFYAFCLMFDQITKDKLNGDIAEIGVYRGNTAALLAQFARRSGRKLHLLDTFEGFATSDLVGIDHDQQMQFADTSLEAVRDFVGETNVSFIKGLFPETAAQLPEDGRYCLVHVDCDLYNPIAAALEYFYPRLVDGGYLVVHDYASLWWPGAERAVDEFFSDKTESVILMPDISGSVVIRKAKR